MQLNIENVTLTRGQKTIIQEANLKVYPNQKIGLIGKNGSGKSSLFALINNELEPNLGHCEINKECSFLLVKQEIASSNDTALEYVISGDTEYTQIMHELKISEKKQDGNKVSELHEQLYRIDGYSIETRASKILNGLGFKPEELKNKVNNFSGGWRVRIHLARALIKNYDLLLLDEPTNHLDLEAILWLEQWLSEYQGAIIIIAHDSSFLDNITTHTLSLENKCLTLYSGNYTAYIKAKAEKMLLLQKMQQKQLERRKKLESFINRFRAKATKAKQAQSRVKMLEKMDDIATIHTESSITFTFKESIRCADPVLKLDELSFSYDDNLILDKIKLSIIKESRIGLLGLNGQGKSTLIKCINGSIKPQSGEIFKTANLKIGYFAQHQLDILKANDTALNYIMRIANETLMQPFLDYLGSFGFSKDDVTREISTLSGGEKARLVLASIIWQKPNLLLLDEPTNHLDLETKEALELALQEYDGAMILISHDRDFINNTCDNLILLHQTKLEDFAGNIEDYIKWMNDTKKEYSKPKKVVKNNNYTKKKEQQNLILKIEKKIDKINEEIKKIQEKLNDTNLYNKENFENLEKITNKERNLKQELEELEHEWLSLNENQ